MASVNFLKCKGAGSVKAIMRHCDEDERQQHRHSNPDIDLTATASNESMKGLNYGEACREYDRRIDELDASSNRNKRKDRVTCFWTFWRLTASRKAERASGSAASGS